MDKPTPEPCIIGLDSPVFVEPAPALVADVLCEDRLEGTQTTRSLNVSHNPYDDHRRSLDHSDRLDHLLLVHLCKGLENTRLGTRRLSNRGTKRATRPDSVLDIQQGRLRPKYVRPSRVSSLLPRSSLIYSSG